VATIPAERLKDLDFDGAGRATKMLVLARTTPADQAAKRAKA
jgi:hypothetical protein